MTIQHKSKRRPARDGGTPDAEARRQLAELFASVADPATLERLFDELLTRAELHDLVLRWRLLKMLHEGVPQRVIAETLGVSLCKITRGSRVLKQPDAVITGLLRQAASPKGM
jgi:TrpR family trp operon transcriptional repressor